MMAALSGRNKLQACCIHLGQARASKVNPWILGHGKGLIYKTKAHYFFREPLTSHPKSDYRQQYG